MSPPRSAPAPRRSSRQSTPTSPGPSSRHGQPRGSLPVTASTPSFSSLAPPSATRSSGRSLSPAPLSSRPKLPEKGNELMVDYKGKLHKVKIQTLKLGGSSDDTITIARVKCPVPKGVPGHIIKRFDTDAVSASSLFRAAYPLASDSEEATEMAWISKSSRSRYGDTKKAGAEHDDSRKLSGTWIPATSAASLAKEYKILRFATELIDYTPTPAVESIEIVDSENDSPVSTRSPRTKRQRVASPPAATPSKAGPSALSGASASGVSILQTLSTDVETGITTETTEVKVDIPVVAPIPSTNGLIATDEEVAAQIEAAQKLVESLKESGTLAELAESTSIEGTKKRALEEDDEDEALPASGTLADVLVDRRGFFGKIFKKAPKARKVPTNAGREIKVAGSQIALMEQQGVTPEGRRWIAGVGLAVAVGATAAAPYLFG